jgi:hypothetical protein
MALLIPETRTCCGNGTSKRGTEQYVVGSIKVKLPHLVRFNDVSKPSPLSPLCSNVTYWSRYLDRLAGYKLLHGMLLGLQAQPRGPGGLHGGESETRKADWPQLRAAITMCRRNGAVLLIAKLDRLARNVYFLSGLMEAGVEFRACDMPVADNFTVHILAAVAEKEARLISEPT